TGAAGLGVDGDRRRRPGGSGFNPGAPGDPGTQGATGANGQHGLNG
ncbi:hypothetical protein NDO01_15170, partial [Mycobacterium tuberculosis]|nr:hypothetical protein [Mycobacterium tuberculosis]